MGLILDVQRNTILVCSLDLAFPNRARGDWRIPSAIPGAISLLDVGSNGNSSAHNVEMSS